MKHLYLIVFLFAAGSLQAGEELDKQAFQFSSFSGDMNKQVQTARAKIEQIEYKEISPEDRQVLVEKFDILENAASSKQQTAEAESAANEILAKAFRDSKLVCTYETPMGTNMKKRICLTAAAKKRIYDKTQANLENRPVRDVARIAN